MPEIKAIYEDNNCKVIIRGGEPYLILNLEKFSKLKNSQLSHCDFIYILYKNNKCEILLVDLKNIGHTTSSEDIISMINDFLDNKIPQTKTLIRDLLNELCVSNPNYYGVLVLPKNVIDKLWENYAIIVHTIGHKFRNSWITSCDNNANLSNTTDVWQREFP